MSKNGLEDYFISEGGKKLKFGYTTGSCAAAAAQAAVMMLCTREEIYQVDLMTPKGILLHLEIEEIEMREDFVSCAVRKDAGDDPDVTDGILIYAKAVPIKQHEIVIKGGVGIGTVTKKGLEQSVGQPAINRVPREMIRENVEYVMNKHHFKKGIEIVLSAPQGVELANKTFNPRLGIQGGISILGTSGIVVPMSEKALIDSIRIEMSMLAAQGMQYILITPGNYGEAYINEHMKLDNTNSMKCSNYVGETIKFAEELKLKGILFVSHIGKFIKVSGGIMNTHSKHSDSRAELMTAAAIGAGASLETAKELLNTLTTEEAVAILIRENILEETMNCIMEKIHFHLEKKSSIVQIGAIVYSSVHGFLGQTELAEELMKHFIKK